MIFPTLRRVGLALVLGHSTAFGASLSSDLFEGSGAETVLEQPLPEAALKDVVRPMTLTNRAYADLAEQLEAGLRDHADYSNILEFAPQLTPNAPDPDRIRWMHALALAATGAEDKARGVMEQVTQPDKDTALAYLAQAMLARRQGDSATAIELTRKAIRKQPSYAYAYNLMGTIKADLGEAEEAIEWFAQAAVYSGRSAIFWRNLGIMQLRQDQITQAASALEKALTIAPNDCVALMASAELYDAAQQPETAEQHVRRCLDDGAGNRLAAVRYLLRQQFAQSDFDEARAIVAAYEDVLVGTDLILAEIALQENRPEAALEHLRHVRESRAGALRRAYAKAMMGAVQDALEIVRTLPMTGTGDATSGAFLEVALTLAAGERPRTFALRMAARDAALVPAIALFEALLLTEENPLAAARQAEAADGVLAGVRFREVPISDWSKLQDPSLRGQLAMGMFWMLRDYKAAAIDTFDRIGPAGTLDQATYLAALAAFQTGDVAQAKTRLAPLASARPEYFSAQVLMAEIHLRHGELEDALRHYRLAAKAHADPGALLRVGVLADMQNQPYVAESALRRFIELNPGNFVGYNQLAWVFIQREMRLDEALALSRKADALQPGNASILDNIGWVMFLQGDPQGAIEKLREANRRSGNANPDILYHLAAVEAKLGAAGTAQVVLDRLFASAPPDHPAVVAGQALAARLQ